MKAVVIVFVLALCTSTVFGKITLTDEQLGDYIQTCLAKTRLSQGFYKSGDENLKYLTEEQKSCFLACMFKKSGIISTDGTVRSVDDNMDDATAKVIENCTETAHGNFCKLAWCLHKTEKFSIPIIANKPRSRPRY